MVCHMEFSTSRFQPFWSLAEVYQFEAVGLAAPFAAKAVKAASGVVAGEVLVILADGRTTAVPASGAVTTP